MLSRRYKIHPTLFCKLLTPTKTTKALPKVPKTTKTILPPNQQGTITPPALLIVTTPAKLNPTLSLGFFAQLCVLWATSSILSMSSSSNSLSYNHFPPTKIHPLFKSGALLATSPTSVSLSLLSLSFILNSLASVLIIMASNVFFLA